MNNVLRLTLILAVLSLGACKGVLRCGFSGAPGVQSQGAVK